MRYKLEKYTSIFVEGITDVAIYRNFLIHTCHFSRLTEEDEERLRERLRRIESSLLPYEHVKFVKRENEYVLIKGFGGRGELEKFCSDQKMVPSFVKRKIDEIRDSYKIGEIRIFIIFDDSIPENCGEEKTLHPIRIVQQRTPEDIIWNLFRELLKTDKGFSDFFSELNPCLKKIEKLGGDIGKRRVNFLKSIIGERCHEHLLEELLKKFKLSAELKKLLPKEIVEAFRVTGDGS